MHNYGLEGGDYHNNDIKQVHKTGPGKLRYRGAPESKTENH